MEDLPTFHLGKLLHASAQTASIYAKEKRDEGGMGRGIQTTATSHMVSVSCFLFSILFYGRQRKTTATSHLVSLKAGGASFLIFAVRCSGVLKRPKNMQVCKCVKSTSVPITLRGVMVLLDGFGWVFLGGLAVVNPFS